MNILITILTLFVLLFPIWVAVHAWRKEYKFISVLIGVSYFFPVIPIVIALITFFIVKPHKPNLDYFPKPRLFVGWGTKFYCTSERANDGSFLTTQWFTAFYIPLIPVQSYRIIMGESNYKWQGYTATTTQYFQILESKKLVKNHLFKVYILLLSFILFTVGIFTSIKSVGLTTDTATSALMGLLVIYLITGYFLLRAK